MKHLLFLTTNNLATNPRLVKEVQLALQLKHRVTIIMFKLNNWSDAKSIQLKDQLLRINNNDESYLTIEEIEAIPSNKLKWICLGISEKLAKKVTGFISTHLKLNALANNRRSLQIYDLAKKIKNRPDLICAHNMGALYPAQKLSALWNVPFVFDVEDYHPGEIVSTDGDVAKKRTEFLMKSLLPKAKSLTFASPLIGKYTLNLIEGHPSHAVVLNGFNDNEFNLLSYSEHDLNKKETPLKLVWFSQKISFGRGLEQLFKALEVISKSDTNIDISLTLIGELDSNFETQELLKICKELEHTNLSIIIKEPLGQQELHDTLNQFDIGLALEFNSRDLNRQICLTNKIITYAQAGLYILATNTKAQEQFITDYPELGILSNQSEVEISETIVKLYQNKDQIKVNKASRFQKGKTLSWDAEQIKIQKLWNQIL
ncbi:hypothetical protein [Formosa algae]|uniref:Glycosyltransferase involved in cell wall biosynthesis n=1 Tax=Formosa algae TaxID=225843 RepID=A0A9X0YII7_9FLAO|nr:hypothetical protein [Formosa algae]MBP1839109.1 glycosyltransferase involved in cell wall biosynthesis [Formosa algae]MDQ0333886.1 glycosyltransferase involved in cell wall biosynthesis [Formosa algae]OEI79742.1 hypothetical protein AST99_12915 [Formosa algae]